ncbi:MAG: HhH-GPD-type base excision DNA repair protein [Acidimicrobiales bacterium]
MAKTPKLYLSGDPAADKLLAKDPFALLIGLVLDQQIPLEWAFFGPLNLTRRLGEVSVTACAEMDEDELVAAFCAKPALHRYPAAMARRVHALAQHIVAEYGGDAARIWTTSSSGAELLRRVKQLPGFGEQKARIFVALLGKQFGVRPDGWDKVAAPFAEPGTHLSIADIDSPDSLSLVREHKRSMKAAKKAAAGKPAGQAAKEAAAGKASVTKAAAVEMAAKKRAAGKASVTKAAAGSPVARRPAPADRSAPARQATPKKATAGQPGR